MNNIDDNILKTETELNRLRQEKARQDSLVTHNPAVLIAEILHDGLCYCNSSHDECGWDYGSWDKPRNIHSQ